MVIIITNKGNKGVEQMQRYGKKRRTFFVVIALLLVTLLNTVVFPDEVDLAAAEGHPNKKVAVGWDHELAIKKDGTVWSWGLNHNGQLGNGTTINQSMPVKVSGLTDIISVSTGYYFSLALRADGTVWTWGNNGSGQLGDGTVTNRSTPVKVSGITDVIAISGGGNHSLALKTDGTVWAWGSNTSGQLGDGTQTNRSTPVQVSGFTNAVSISAGEGHSVALRADGTVWAWGNNVGGSLGNGTNDNQSAPVQVVGLADIDSISTKGGFTFALKKGGTVWAWGNNSGGYLGDGTNVNRNTPVQISGLSDITSITAGVYHSFALRSDGTLWGWGWNFGGRLGNGTNADSSIPVKVKGSMSIVDIDANAASVALQSDGTVWAAGPNHYGQLGNGSSTSSNVFVQTQGFGTVSLTANSSTPSTMELTYGANVSVAKFVVKRGTTVLSCPPTGTNLSCQDQGLTPGTSYTYTVEAYDANNNLIDSQFATVTAGGSTVPIVKVLAGSTTVPAGSTMTAQVVVDHAVNLYAEDVAVSYDPALFTFVSATPANEGLKIYHQSEETSGTVRLVVASQGAQYGLHDTATVLNLNFTAKDVAGKGNITVSKGLVANALGEEIVPTLGGTEFTVVRTDADVNEDGKVSLGDLAITGYQYGMDKSLWTFPKADLDGNDAVDDFDLSAIVQSILENETEPLSSVQ